MKIYKEDDRSKAICEVCEKIVDTTFAIRDVPFSDGTGVVKGILVATCDCCGEVVSIPAQSSRAINQTKKGFVAKDEACPSASEE